jgi:hypothetical protein
MSRPTPRSGFEHSRAGIAESLRAGREDGDSMMIWTERRPRRLTESTGPGGLRRRAHNELCS